MHLVVGLGNPGRKYEGNRHNVGFMAAEEIRRREALPEWREKFSGLFAKGDRVAVLLPQTFMNVSGESAQPAAAFLDIAPREVVVIHDDLDIPFGDVRVKVGGGHGGHNGLRSLVERLGADFVRVRVGIGRPPPGFRGDVADFVLANFDGAERAELPDLVARAADAALKVVALGAAAAMNAVNTKPAPANAKKNGPDL